MRIGFLAMSGLRAHDPELLRTSSCDDHALLSATAWDVNGDAFRLEFEVRPGGVAFQGDADPEALLSPELIGESLTASPALLSLQFEGQVPNARLTRSKAEQGAGPEARPMIEGKWIKPP